MNELTEYLYTYFDEVEPKEFYRCIFPEGELQTKGEYEKGKYNGIIIEITNDDFIDDKGRKRPVIKRHTLTDDLDKIDEVCSRDNFCLMSPISYVGKKRDSINARNMYALVVEIDGLLVKNGKQIGIINLFHQIDTAERIPKPTYVVSSGNGLHLYYVFEKPIPLFENIHEQLEVYKTELTRIIWHDSITKLTDDLVQYEPICQGFRVVGTKTKHEDTSIRTRAFETGNKVDMDYMNSFVEDEYQVKEFAYKSKLTFSKAKQMYPEWAKKIENNDKSKGAWALNRNVYEWWKRKIMEGAKCGHRYWCLRMLSIYAVKCSNYDEKKNPNPVTYDELEVDIFSFLEFLDSITKEGFEGFTREDCLAALIGFDSCWNTYPIDKIMYRTGIKFKKNKRNGRKQKDHIRIMNFVRDEINQNKTWNKVGNGRKPKEDIVRQWRLKNPNGKKAECIRETGLDKKTVYKWWDEDNQIRKTKEIKVDDLIEEDSFEIVEEPDDQFQRDLVEYLKQLPEEERILIFEKAKAK